VVRRNRIVVERFPGFWGSLDVETWCSGSSRLCAERRTTFRDDAGVAAESATLWVNLETDGGVPRRLGDDFHAAFGPSAAGRRVKSRLIHPPAPEPTGEEPAWAFRATDLDVAAHVNNAALWHVVEQELIDAYDEPERIDAEIEYPSAATGAPARLLRDGSLRWLTDGDGQTLASIKLAAAAPLT
jgi:acyl-ACP thioesterase